MEVFKKENNVFGLLSEAVSEGILVVNKDQEIVATNQSTNDLFGYDKDELIGKKLDILIPKEFHNNHSSHFNKFVANSDKRQMGHGRDLFGLRKDGTRFPVEAGLNPFTIYDNEYVMALVIDITVRKEYEQQIKTLNTQLEQKVVQRTEELNKSIEKLEGEINKRKEAEHKIKESLRKERELNNLKTKFLSLVSHEFKTPLSGILTSSTLVGKYTQTEQQEKREKHLGTIQSKVKYLNNILNDFLSIERFESGKVSYKFSQFPLSKVINEVVYNANMLLKNGQAINYPQEIDEIIIEFDHKILELVLTNLINNAIKYSPENTTIDIKVKMQKDNLTIEVNDEGLGIPKEEQKFVFNRYFRAENVLLTEGTGIGLNIVKSHLESLGGSITFTSVEGQGSSFIIQLPTAINQ